MAYPLFHEAEPRPLPAAMARDWFSAEFPGEGQHLEFKQGMPEQKVREAVAAFSNADGGVILLGVSDDGQVHGLSVEGEAIARLHRTVASVRNPGRYETHELRVGDKGVLVLSVGRRREGFAQLPDGRILVRRGAMNTPLFDIELERFVSERSLTRFESTPVAVPLTRCAPALVERLRLVHGWSEDHLPERLSEAGLVDTAATEASLTVAGALYLLQRPADVLGKAYIEIFRYRGTSPTYDRRMEIDGPVDEQVERATEILMDELGAEVVVLGLRRHELPRVPREVLREVIANAVAHRTYEATGQPVRIEIRTDRVTVVSPGSLPEPVTLANLREQNAPRNNVVIRTLRRYGLAEDAGMGIDVIQDTMQAALLDPPQFAADSARVEVTLPLSSTVTPRERAWITEVEQRGDIRSGDRILLVHAARGEPLTNSSARELLGIDSVHARAALQRLCGQGFLVRHGDRGGAGYSLAVGLGPPAGLGMDENELRRIVLAMADEGRVTNEAVRSRTGLDRARALSLLTALVDEGELQRHGQRRGSYYTRT